jgi:hypothetical protein
MELNVASGGRADGAHLLFRHHALLAIANAVDTICTVLMVSRHHSHNLENAGGDVGISDAADKLDGLTDMEFARHGSFSSRNRVNSQAIIALVRPA